MKSWILFLSLFIGFFTPIEAEEKHIYVIKNESSYHLGMRYKEDSTFFNQFFGIYSLKIKPGGCISIDTGGDPERQIVKVFEDGFALFETEIGYLYLTERISLAFHSDKNYHTFRDIEDLTSDESISINFNGKVFYDNVFIESKKTDHPQEICSTRIADLNPTIEE